MKNTEIFRSMKRSLWRKAMTVCWMKIRLNNSWQRTRSMEEEAIIDAAADGEAEASAVDGVAEASAADGVDTVGAVAGAEDGAEDGDEECGFRLI